mmetsp:Transcript_316/g.1028  ORF Transcript_316/g.1028 Transcript_316/m.1028 type:complete len:118 (+) Transcript_316:179-532(+)
MVMMVECHCPIALETAAAAAPATPAADPVPKKSRRIRAKTTAHKAPTVPCFLDLRTMDISAPTKAANAPATIHRCRHIQDRVIRRVGESSVAMVAWERARGRAGLREESGGVEAVGS